MAANMVVKWSKTRKYACSYPATPSSGDPVVTGQIPGVALTTEDTNGDTTVALDGDFNLSVKGIDGNGNSAVADGDILYYTNGDTPPLSKKATGVRFGYARASVGSSSTGTIRVQVGY